MTAEKSHRSRLGRLDSDLGGGLGEIDRVPARLHLAGRGCPLCGGVGARIGEKDGVPLRECCGVLLAWAWGSAAEYERQYEAEYHDSEMTRSGRATFVARDAEYLQTALARLTVLRMLYPRPVSLLDVGAGTGSLVALAPSFGFIAEGLEPSRALCEWAASQGRRVKCGTWLDAAPLFYRERWDCITLYDVLEHILEPAAALRSLAALLSRNGVLVVEWPEYGSPQQASEGLPAWRHCKPREHPALWSDEAARELFRRAGLRWEATIRPLGATLGKACYYLRSE